VRLAKSCVREMLSILVRYGAELGLPGCLELHQVLGLMVLTVPEDIRRAWKAARPKKTGMRYEHAAAIVAEGLKRGTRRHRSVALGVAAQFELTMRQADVIGVWETPGQGEVVDPSAIIRGRWIWRPGLRFEDFAAGQLDLETMKNAGRAVFDVTAYPLFQQALAAVPAMERYGPLVTDEGGSPVSRRYYWDLYRDVADAAGVPRNVWNMHARHGGASEAQQAGVALQDIAEHAQHADINTTRKHYIIPSVETSRRVAKQRVAHRQMKVDKG
jgi:integrase